MLNTITVLYHDKNPKLSLEKNWDIDITREFGSNIILEDPDWDNKLLHNFDQLGYIERAEMALVIAAKGVDSVYVVPEFDNLIEYINELVTKRTKDPTHRFQFVTRNEGHSFFGEVIIDKAGARPEVKIFICDPSGTSVSKFSESIIAIENASVEIFIPPPCLEMLKACGCSFISLDGAFRLRNQEKYENIYQSPIVHQTSIADIQIKIVPLPLRLLRSSQQEDHIALLNNSQVIVNKNGQTASESVEPFIKTINNRTLNLRNEHKMNRYKYKLKNFIKENNIQSLEELKPIIQKHSIQGLEAYTQDQLKIGR
jgi:hypothetical protein